MNSVQFIDPLPAQPVTPYPLVNNYDTTYLIIALTI